jgi:hypothetical protein
MKFMFFSDDNGASIARSFDDIASVTDAGFKGSVEIVDEDGVTVSRVEDVVIDVHQTDDMREVLIGLVGDIQVNGHNAELVYTTGDCDIFAKALSQVVPEGTVVGVFDPLDEDGDFVVGAHHLVHAALQIGSEIIDIGGVRDRSQWLMQLDHLGSEEMYIDPISRGRWEGLRPKPPDENDMAIARKIAELLVFCVDATRPLARFDMQA